MAEMKLYELEMLRSRIYHGEQELISTLTPEQFFALLSHDYDTGFAAGKASAQKEILCMLAADGMPAEKIPMLLSPFALPLLAQARLQYFLGRPYWWR